MIAMEHVENLEGLDQAVNLPKDVVALFDALTKEGPVTPPAFDEEMGVEGME